MPGFDEETRASGFDPGSKERFSSRVDAYAKYRPSYPQAIVDSLKRKFPPALFGPLAVADIGSGTGIFSRLLLENDCTVYAVEPNAQMRQRAEETLSVFRGFCSVIGEATHTALPDRSVDVVAAAQAFHWFATQGAVREFRRILKDAGLVMLVWNDRRTGFDEFHEEYERLLIRYCPEYVEVNHRKITLQRICDLFPRWRISVERFQNNQRFDLEGLRGRLESSSYCPTPDDPDYSPLMTQLGELFAKHNRNGQITLRQDTVAYFAVPFRYDEK